MMDVFRKKEYAPVPTASQQEEKRSRVTAEASYTIGEYDIQILSAKYSDGLGNLA